MEDRWTRLDLAHDRRDIRHIIYDLWKGLCAMIDAINEANGNPMLEPVELQWKDMKVQLGGDGWEWKSGNVVVFDEDTKRVDRIEVTFAASREIESAKIVVADTDGETLWEGAIETRKSGDDYTGEAVVSGLRWEAGKTYYVKVVAEDMYETALDYHVGGMEMAYSLGSLEWEDDSVNDTFAPITYMTSESIKHSLNILYLKYLRGYYRQGKTSVKVYDNKDKRYVYERQNISHNREGIDLSGSGAELTFVAGRSYDVEVAIENFSGEAVDDQLTLQFKWGVPTFKNASVFPVNEDDERIENIVGDETIRYVAWQLTADEYRENIDKVRIYADSLMVYEKTEDISLGISNFVTLADDKVFAVPNGGRVKLKLAVVGKDGVERVAKETDIVSKMKPTYIYYGGAAAVPTEIEDGAAFEPVDGSSATIDETIKAKVYWVAVPDGYSIKSWNETVLGTSIVYSKADVTTMKDGLTYTIYYKQTAAAASKPHRIVIVK